MRTERSLPAFALIVLTVATILSCKKEHRNPSTSCKIIGYYDTVTNRGAYSTSFTELSYDQDGRISFVLSGKRDSLSIGWVFHYNGNKIVATPNVTNGPGVDTITLNDNGQPVTMQFEEINHAYRSHSEYFYGDSGRISYMLYYDQHGNLIDTAKYSYTNGDMTSIDHGHGNITRYSYYTDKIASDAEFSRIESLTTYGVIFPSSKHMLKSVQDVGYLESFSYTFDNAGRIVSGEETIIATGGIVTKRTYVYDCG
ncbi:hypothetical protein Q4E93_00440 [Flavitalea sp. BT771]|uniref:hypothetical protein n=1 Tax=Flavitalea sp. BT771 TaxID=3063329 RepID=UPI0026E40EBE|nr:hypothetical protein [Flavitalea sp. BT771]MDO6429031.1 hypothetical protein [Flavitalea sp. BT771]MDV6218841.1 hypothetical protein [Flavitalea sp. BT771]